MIGKAVLFFVLASTFLFIIPKLAFAVNWQYPLQRTLERSSYKSFGQYFNKSSYLDRENLFPNQFIGYHAGTDLEIFPEEKDVNVPIFAVSDGTISFVGSVTGYGGLILEKFDNIDLTALYGHLKLSGTSFRVGDHVQTGQTLTFLGNAYSSETAGERKHLHFAIYKGHDLYFKGYENTREVLDQKWIDPLQFLQTRVSNISLTVTPNSTKENNNIFNTVWKKIITLFYRLGWHQ